VRLADGVNEPDTDRVRHYQSIYGTFRQLYPALHSRQSAVVRG
jgi:hypothetical protein